MINRTDLIAFKKKHGLTYRALGELLSGLSHKVLQNWVAGVNDPPVYLDRALNDVERELDARKKKK